MADPQKRQTAAGCGVWLLAALLVVSAIVLAESHSTIALMLAILLEIIFASGFLYGLFRFVFVKGKRGKGFMMAFWSFIFLLFSFYAHHEARLSPEERTKEKEEIAKTEAQDSEKHREQQERERQPQIGVPIEVGSFVYTVNNVTWKNVIGKGELIQQHPDAAYLVIDLTVQNVSSKPQFVDSPSLVDPGGRTYALTSNVFIVEGSQFLLKELNPQVQSRGNVVFDVPYSSYSLRLGGGMGSLLHKVKTVPVVIYR